MPLKRGATDKTSWRMVSKLQPQAPGIRRGAQRSRPQGGTSANARARRSPTRSAAKGGAQMNDATGRLVHLLATDPNGTKLQNVSYDFNDLRRHREYEAMTAPLSVRKAGRSCAPGHSWHQGLHGVPSVFSLLFLIGCSGMSPRTEFPGMPSRDRPNRQTIHVTIEKFNPHEQEILAATLAEFGHGTFALAREPSKAALPRLHLIKVEPVTRECVLHAIPGLEKKRWPQSMRVTFTLRAQFQGVYPETLLDATSRRAIDVWDSDRSRCPEDARAVPWAFRAQVVDLVCRLLTEVCGRPVDEAQKN